VASPWGLSNSAALSSRSAQPRSPSLLSPPSPHPRSRTLQSGAAMDAAAKLHGHCRSPTSALLVPQSSATSSSPTRAAPSALFSRSELSPELITAMAVCRALGYARSQAITSHRGASHDCQRVRGDPRVPPRHFPNIDVPPPAGAASSRRPPCFDSRQGPHATI
jgi:hypothetical protein